MVSVYFFKKLKFTFQFGGEFIHRGQIVLSYGLRKIFGVHLDLAVFVVLLLTRDLAIYICFIALVTLTHWLTTGGCARRCNELQFFPVGAEESLKHTSSESSDRGKMDLVKFSYDMAVGSDVRSSRGHGCCLERTQAASYQNQ